MVILICQFGMLEIIFGILLNYQIYLWMKIKIITVSFYNVPCELINELKKSGKVIQINFFAHIQTFEISANWFACQGFS